MDIPLLVANPMAGYWYLESVTSSANNRSAYTDSSLLRSIWAPEGKFQLLRKMLEAKRAETGLSTDEILQKVRAISFLGERKYLGKPDI